MYSNDLIQERQLAIENYLHYLEGREEQSALIKGLQRKLRAYGRNQIYSKLSISQWQELELAFNAYQNEPNSNTEYNLQIVLDNLSRDSRNFSHSETYNDEANTLIATLNQTLSEVEAVNSSASRSLSTIEISKIAVEAAEAQIQQLLENVQEDEETAKTSWNDLSRELQDAIKANKELEVKYTQSLEEADELKETLETTIEKAIAELGNSLDTALFKEYHKVCESKEFTALWWLGGFFFLIIVLTVKNLIGVFHPSWVYPPIPVGGVDPIIGWLLPRIVINLPIASLAIFSMQRYLREQRLAEEYRFKSTCALHFNAYMELVQKLAKDDTDKEYRDFLVEQINQLFSSPTERIYKDSNVKSLDDLSKYLGLISPQLEKLFSIVKNVHHDVSDSTNKL